VDVFELRESVDYATGEITSTRAWSGEIAVASRDVLSAIQDDGPPGRRRRSLAAMTLPDVEQLVSRAVGRPVEWRRGGPSRRDCQEVREAWTSDEEASMRHTQYALGFDAMIKKVLETLP
jgi:hypothetical protein